MKKLAAIYVPSLNIAYMTEGDGFPQELHKTPLYGAKEIIDRSQQFDDGHTENHFEVKGTSFTRVILDVPVILFYADVEGVSER